MQLAHLGNAGIVINCGRPGRNVMTIWKARGKSVTTSCIVPGAGGTRASDLGLRLES